jgi:acyl-CoA synthetase (AMP-forming)/AMP-acid ligase II
VTVLGPDDHRLEGPPEEVEKRARRLASVGRPLPDVELRIADEEGLPLGTGAVGEVWIRAERTMLGYYGLEEATAQVYRDGWLRTGDLGWLDEGGYLFLTGRQSDMIIRGGENIAPEEIEIVLASHPGVEEVAVIGLPDEEWGERVGAVVVRAAGFEVSAEELGEFCRTRLASFKKPEAIFFLDALPRNSLGKLLRSELREACRDQA